MAIFLLATSAIAQDLNVVTKLSHYDRQSGRWLPLARSLTLFHGAKTHDFVEAVGEVVIHEPAESQFVILSLNGNKVATRIRYEELLNYLKVARAETDKYIDELKSLPQPASRRSIEALEFQLQPQFQTNFDAATSKLWLSSPFIKYEVDTAEVERPRVLERYLNWADWTARLNYILHPQAVTPDIRIALNQALRERGRLPTQVALTLTIEDETHLRAEHSFEWELHSFDRKSIGDWEKIRNANDVRWVNLPEYQRILVSASNRRAR